MEIINCTNPHLTVGHFSEVKEFTENKKVFLVSPNFKNWGLGVGREGTTKKAPDWKYVQMPGYLDLKEKAPCNVLSRVWSCTCSAVMWHLCSRGCRASVRYATKSLMKMSLLPVSWSAISSGNPPSYTRPFYPLHSLTQRETSLHLLDQNWADIDLVAQWSIYSFITLPHLYSTATKERIFSPH